MTRKMKDSGIEWIGEIPEDWGTSRLKNFIISRQSGVWGKDEDPENYENNIVCIRIADFDYPKMTIRKDREFTLRNYTKSEIAKYTLHKGDILVEKSGGGEKTPVGRTIVWNEDFKALYANFIERLRLDESLVMPMFAQFCFYAFYGMGGSNLYFNQTTGLQNLDMSKMLNSLNFPIPETSEQISIINLLNKKTKQIEEMKTTIINEIQTLEDYKKSVITESVTKGLDENVEMKDSGIEWIGEIPKHWELIKGKYILKLLKKPVKDSDEVITCFRDGEVTLRSKRREEGFTFADKEIGYQGIDVGDLVVHGMDGFAGAIGISDSRGKGSPVLNVLYSICDKRYLMFYLRAMSYSDIFSALATGIRVRSVDLRWNKLANLPYPLPSKDEQNKIATFIENELYKTDRLISTKQKQLQILEEYKKSLIYEYVTGKKVVEDVGTI